MNVYALDDNNKIRSQQALILKKNGTRMSKSINQKYILLVKRLMSVRFKNTF